MLPSIVLVVALALTMCIIGFLVKQEFSPGAAFLCAIAWGVFHYLS